MAEFQEVARHWKRMCKKYWTATTCHGCPISEHEHRYEACSAYDADVAKMEEFVMIWGKKNPEPQYPTWGEWLAEKGELCKNWKDIRVISSAGSSASGVIGWFYKEISTDIAEKLGIEPKNG